MPFSKLKVAAGVVLLSICVCFASSFCMNCGTQLLTGANFCGQCGTMVGGVATPSAPAEIQNIQAMPIVAPQIENVAEQTQTAQSTQQIVRHIAVNSGISFAEQFEAGNTILKIHNLDDFIEFQRLRVVRQQTFEGREIHLMNDIIVFDTTGSNTWSANFPTIWMIGTNNIRNFWLANNQPRNYNTERQQFYLQRFPTYYNTRVPAWKIETDFPRPAQFSGTFDGNGHYVRGLYNTSLFGNTIRNAVVRNLNISHSFFGEASIAGKSINSTIDNVNISANVIGGGAGGLVRKTNNTRISNSSFSGTVSSTSMSSTGGIASVARNSSILRENTFNGALTGRIKKTDGIGFTSLNSAAVGNTDNSVIAEKQRFLFMPEAAYSWGLGEYGMSTAGFNVLLGAIISRNFSLTIGSGVHFDHLDVRHDEIIHERPSPLPETGSWLISEALVYKDFILAPIFLRPKYYFSQNHISPTISADIGFEIMNTSFYFSPSFGMSFGRFNVSLGYKMHSVEYTEVIHSTLRWRLEYGDTVRKQNNALSLSIGFDTGWGMW